MVNITLANRNGRLIVKVWRKDADKLDNNTEIK